MAPKDRSSSPPAAERASKTAARGETGETLKAAADGEAGERAKAGATPKAGARAAAARGKSRAAGLRVGKRKRKWAMSADERRHVRRSNVLKAVACVAVLAVCLALALLVGTDEYRPTPMGWVPLVACCTAVVLAFAYVRVLKHSLKLLEKSSVSDCRRDEKVHFTVRFANRCPLFFFRVEAHFYTADLYGNPVSHAATTLALAPFERYDMRFTAKFDHIGTYQAGLDRVVVYDFLRLFSATIPGPGRVRVHVTPRLVPVPKLEFSNEAVVETTKAARSTLSDSMDYAAVRDYVWGDPLKNIHWKISARTEHYMTKLFETYNNPGVAVVMDFYGPGRDAAELMDMFDAVVESGFSVARFARQRGMDTEIHYCDRTGARVHRATWRESDLPQIVADMPRFSSEPARAADAIGLLREQIQSIHGQSNIVVCTANLSAQMVETVISAKVHRREPIMLAVVPRGLEGRERDRWMAPITRLDVAGVAYAVLESSDDLSKMGRNDER